MRLLTLNAWGGRVHDKLLPFLKHEATQVDIFCFQEIYHTESDQQAGRTVPPPQFNIFDRISSVLGDEFQGWYAPAQSGFDDTGKVEHHLEYGNAVFVRKSISVLSYEEIYVHKQKNSRLRDEDGQPRSIQVLRLAGDGDGNETTVINFHGLWQAGTNKQDNLDRFEQSKKIREVIERAAGPVILCGDFNLLPGGKSIAILEEGMRNLIKEYGITSTRSSYYPLSKPTRHADYILVNEKITVKNFQVMTEEVSDHLALNLDFDIK